MLSIGRVLPCRHTALALGLAALGVAACQEAPSAALDPTPLAEASATSAAPPTPEPRPSRTPMPGATQQTEAAIATVVASSPPEVLAAIASSDGRWRAETVRHDCVELERDGYREQRAYERLRVTDEDSGETWGADQQLQHCGGLGAFGLAPRRFSPGGRYLYYTSSREGAPDGCPPVWYRSLLRVDLASRDVEVVGGGVWSPDERMLASPIGAPGAVGRQLTIWGVDDPEPLSRASIGSREEARDEVLAGMRWSPSGEQVALLLGEYRCPPDGVGSGRVVVVQATTGDAREHELVSEADVAGPRWEGEGELRLDEVEGPTWRLDLEDGAQERVAEEGSSTEEDARAREAAASQTTLPGLEGLAGESPYSVHPLGVHEDHADGRSWDAEPGAETLLGVRDANDELAAVWRLPEGGSLRSVSDSISPDGRWLAFFSGDLPDMHLVRPITTPLELHLWDLRAGEEAFRTPLLHDGLRDELRGAVEADVADHDGPEALAAMSWDEAPGSGGISRLAWFAEEEVAALLTGIGDLRWSPDGQSLAFVGAREGADSDLYVLVVENGEVRQVSDEPTHVVNMSWSPDGDWLLHEGSPHAFRGSGSVDATVTHLSAADGSGTRRVWDRGSGTGSPWLDRWPLAWIGDAEAIVHSAGNGCGVCGLLKVDAATGTTLTLGSSTGTDLAVDPIGRTAAVSRRDDPDPEDTGIHVIALEDGGSERVLDLACDLEPWGAAERPYVRLSAYESDCGTVAFGGDAGDLVLENPEGLRSTSISPDGSWRVLYGEAGWRLYDRDSVQQGAQLLHEAATVEDTPWLPVEAVAWHPDETRLYWLAGKALWAADLPGGTPRRVGPWPRRDGWAPELDLAWLER